MADAHADHHDRPAHLQHHFESSTQQFDSTKFGMWLFLATELLLFGGLFCAYAVYRGNHPEVFLYAHQYLDTTWGAINTVVLLCSSLTMAWGVRAAQLEQRKLLVVLLSLTLLGGFGFMSIKFVEYKAKFEHGLLWAKAYHPAEHDAGHGAEGAGAAAGGHADAATADHDAASGGHADADVGAGEHAAAAPTAAEPTPAPAESAAAEPGRFVPEATTLVAAGIAPAGLDPDVIADTRDTIVAHGPTEAPENTQTFFSIYFMMTGLHGLHVLVGMGLIGWILVRSLGGAFSKDYFTPVDLVGLYWHLVDLIWIFLFPLLYLIH